MASDKPAADAQTDQDIFSDLGKISIVIILLAALLYLVGLFSFPTAENHEVALGAANVALTLGILAVYADTREFTQAQVSISEKQSDIDESLEALEYGRSSPNILADAKFIVDEEAIELSIDNLGGGAAWDLQLRATCDLLSVTSDEQVFEERGVLELDVNDPLRYLVTSEEVSTEEWTTQLDLRTDPADGEYSLTPDDTLPANTKDRIYRFTPYTMVLDGQNLASPAVWDVLSSVTKHRYSPFDQNGNYIGSDTSELAAKALDEFDFDIARYRVVLEYKSDITEQESNSGLAEETVLDYVFVLYPWLDIQERVEKGTRTELLDTGAHPMAPPRIEQILELARTWLENHSVD